MDPRSEPTFRIPRSLVRAVAELDAAHGWDSLPVLHEPRVLDLGADGGAFAVLASEVWPGAIIRCHEPSSERLLVLRENTRGLRVECDGTLDAVALDPCDVLRIDTREVDLSLLEGYRHLEGVAVFLVTTLHDRDAELAHRLAAGAGWVPIGRHTATSGRTTLRFARADLLTRRAVDEVPPLPTEATTDAPPAELHPIPYRSRSMHLYVSMIALPGKAWSQVEHYLHALGSICQERGVGLTLARESMTGVDRARNVQTERCLKLARTAASPDRPTHMLHLDSDLVFDPEDVLKLLRSDLDVTAIVYPRKEIDWDRVVRAVEAGVPVAELPRYAASFVFNYAGGQRLKHPELGTFIEIEEVGTGCLMIKVDALARYADAHREELEYVSDYPPFYNVHHQFFHCERDPSCPREAKLRDLKRAAVALLEATNTEAPPAAEVGALTKAALGWSRTVGDPTSIGRYLTEDYSFCRRWRLMGGKIYALMEAEIGHIGKHVYRGALHRAVPTRDAPATGGKAQE